MTPVERILSTAMNEIGYLEKASNNQLDDKTANAGYNNWTKYARDMDSLKMYNGRKNGYAWCDMFVDWCMVKTFGLDDALKITGQSLGGEGAGCTSSANYYKRMGQFFKSNPQPGDQIFFSKDGGKSMNHTGLVVRVTKDKVYTIEGNTSSAAGVVPNGGAVREKSYAINYSKIGGYGRPKYELIKVEEDDEDMTQETFNKMMDQYLIELAQKPASFEQSALIWAQNNGILRGDDSGNLMPKKFMTRGELTVVLQRLVEKLNKDV